MTLRLTVPIFATCVLAAGLPAQQARPLPAPDAKFEEPFSSINAGALRELRDGRVIVADPRDKVVQRLDFRTGAMTGIGREGSGPAEFGLPMRLFAAAADTTLLFDPLNSRFLTISPDAKPIATFRVEPEAARPARGGPGGGMMMVGLGFSARTSDAKGRLYAEGSGVAPGPDGQPMPADSVPLMRYDRGTQRLDTITYVAVQKANVQSSGSQGNVQLMIGAANPLTPRDEWTVFPDGRVAVVRARDYHVEYFLPDGSKRTGPAVRYTPIRMSAAETRFEEELRNRERANRMSMMVTQDGSGTRRTAQMGPPPGAPPLRPLTDWPEVKPPFRAGPASVLARPNGELWVRRTESASSKGSTYDVFNAQGAVTHQVTLPEGTTLVGFGNGTVYTTVRDEDDLVYLQRHRMP